jgi:iron complex outermembrane receptor protein
MFGTWRSGQEGAGEITVSGGLVYVGERPGDDVASGFELPDYVTARVNLGYQVTERLSAHLDIENLFDTYYLESSFSNVWIAPGAARTVTARLRWSY